MYERIAELAVEFYGQWKAGKIEITAFQLRAMARLYLYLAAAEKLAGFRLFQYGLLYAFFGLYMSDFYGVDVDDLDHGMVSAWVRSERIHSPA